MSQASNDSKLRCIGNDVHKSTFKSNEAARTRNSGGSFSASNVKPYNNDLFYNFGDFENNSQDRSNVLNPINNSDSLDGLRPNTLLNPIVNQRKSRGLYKEK